ncbi:MAG: YraN family protein [Bacteroidales bacterium]|nr:YraN family protein [Bacteroidales bacterium]
MGEAIEKERSVIGRKGENAALEYLRQRGLTFRERNWRHGHLEVDLIFEDDRYLRIVEVKTLLERDGFSPSENVTRRKAEKLISAARHYVTEKHPGKEVAFDVVTVVIKDDGEMEIDYIPEAFWPLEGNWFAT